MIASTRMLPMSAGQRQSQSVQLASDFTRHPPTPEHSIVRLCCRHTRHLACSLRISDQWSTLCTAVCSTSRNDEVVDHCAAMASTMLLRLPESSGGRGPSAG